MFDCLISPSSLAAASNHCATPRCRQGQRLASRSLCGAGTFIWPYTDGTGGKMGTVTNQRGKTVGSCFCSRAVSVPAPSLATSAVDCRRSPVPKSRWRSRRNRVCAAVGEDRSRSRPPHTAQRVPPPEIRFGLKGRWRLAGGQPPRAAQPPERVQKASGALEGCWTQSPRQPGRQKGSPAPQLLQNSMPGCCPDALFS